MEYDLTNHVRERYAERIMGKTNKLDIQNFISQHEDKIYDDIEKMIQYGKVIYEGQQVRSKDPRPARYILNHNWLVVVNHIDKKVVTLYKIDLGAGDEINNQYIQVMLDKLDLAREKANEKIAVIKELEDSYEIAIQENNELIQDYKNKIKTLEEQNKCLHKLLTDERSDRNIAEEEMREVIATMTTGTKF
jgi:hypothetical protein